MSGGIPMVYRCKLDGEKFETYEDLIVHLEKNHNDSIPKDFSTTQFEFALRTGKTEGQCVVCRRLSSWNEKTRKYHRFCSNPACKQRYIETARKNMIGKFGKVHLLNDPEHQKKMLANRKISGEYVWSDGHKIPYVGTYERDFLHFLDVFMEYESGDIMSPSPHVYYYTYNGERRFYIPDFFIPSLNLEIEVKDGGANQNNHPKIQKVDKEKEKLKDAVLTSQKEFSYVKIVNKEYDPFFEYLHRIKKQYQETKDKDWMKEKPIFIVRESTYVDIDSVTESSKIYYGVTDEEKKSGYIHYKKDNRFDGKGVNTSLQGLQNFIKDHHMGKHIKHYIVLNRDDFEVNDHIDIDTKYDMISVKTPFDIKIDHVRPLFENIHEINKVPVYIVLTSTSTIVARMVRQYTGNKYSHASISFDPDLKELYSFGRKDRLSWPSFINEDIMDGIYKDSITTAKYGLFVTFMTPEQVKMMRARLDEFKENAKKMKYSFIGLINYSMGKETRRDNEYFCSQFVAEILQSAQTDMIDRHPSLYSPQQLGQLNNVYLVAEGILRDYNGDNVRRKTKSILNKIEQPVAVGEGTSLQEDFETIKCADELDDTIAYPSQRETDETMRMVSAVTSKLGYSRLPIHLTSPMFSLAFANYLGMDGYTCEELKTYLMNEMEDTSSADRYLFDREISVGIFILKTIMNSVPDKRSEYQELIRWMNHELRFKLDK
jgi:hypothetical protein